MQSNTSAKRDFAPCTIFGPSHGAAAMQLELPLWPRGSLYGELVAFRQMRAPFLAKETLRDYREKETWLCEMFGPLTRLQNIGFSELERVAEREGPLGAGRVMFVTMRKRFFHLIATAKYAANRKVIDRQDVPALPIMPNDSVPGERTVELKEFMQFRLALAGRFRDYSDLAMGTGHRSTDTYTMARWMLDPDYEWKNESGEVVRRGRFWRRSNKTKGSKIREVCPPTWFPMEEWFQPIAKAMLAANPGSPESLVVGRVSCSKAFNSACDRCEIERISPSRDMRRSYASMLLSLGYRQEYIRLAIGHAGSPQFSPDGRFLGSRTPTVAERHYMRMTNALVLEQIASVSQRSQRP